MTSLEEFLSIHDKNLMKEPIDKIEKMNFNSGGTIRPDLNAITDVFGMVDDFYKVGESERLGGISQVLGKILQISHITTKYLKNSGPVSEEDYKYLTSPSSPDPESSLIIDRVLSLSFNMYDKHSEKIAKDIKAWGKKDNRFHSGLNNINSMIRRSWSTGGRTKSYNGKSVMNKLRENFMHRYEVTRQNRETVYSHLDAYKEASKAASENSDTPGFIELSARIFDKERALEKSLISYQIDGHSKALVQSEFSPIKKETRERLNRSYLKHCESYHTELKDSLASLKKLIKNPTENHEALDSMKESIESRLIQLESAGKELGYPDLQSVNLHFPEMISIFDDYSKIKRKVKQYHSLSEELTSFEREAHHSIQSLEQALTLNERINNIVEVKNAKFTDEDRNRLENSYVIGFTSLMNNIGQVFDSYLSLDEFKLGQLNAFSIRFKELKDKIDSLTSVESGPAKELLSIQNNRKRIDAAVSQYARFIEVGDELNKGKSLYAVNVFDDISKSEEDLKAFHEGILYKSRDLEKRFQDIINEGIRHQEESYRERLNKNCRKALSDIKGTIDEKDPKKKLEVLKVNVKNLEGILDSEGISEDNRRLYNDLRLQIEEIESKENRWMKRIWNRFSVKVIEPTKKTFYLDSSCLINAPYCYKNFEENDVVIPYLCIEETNTVKDNLHKADVRPDIVRFFKGLRDVIAKGKSAGESPETGITVNEYGGKLFLPPPAQGYVSVQDEKVVDNLILKYIKEHKTKGRKILVTDDSGLSVKGDIAGISSEPYTTEQIDLDKLFKGTRYLDISQSVLSHYRESGKLDMKIEDPINNEVFILTNKDNKNDIELLRYNEGEFHKLRFSDPSQRVLGSIRPRNIEQIMALEALTNPNIDLVVLKGPAGTGKDFLSLVSGIDMVQKERYDRVLVTRAFIEVGSPMGYLKGSLEEKMDPWFGFIYDQLESISRVNKLPYSKFKDMVFEKIASFIPITYMRGRNIAQRYIIVSEAQNLSKGFLKTIITRADVGTKIVINGDDTQIDARHLNEYNCGLNVIIDAWTGENNFMVVPLYKTQRARLAEQGATYI